MIRMGKSSRLNEDESTPNEEAVTNPAVSLRSDPSANAFSESELMAKDIKEGRLSGFVGCGTVLTGETSFDSMLRIDGHIKGQVTSEDGALIIGATGQVDADITVASAVVNGAVNGDIVTTEKLTLGRSARVVGNIQAPRLIIEDGAILEGGCTMVKSIEEFETRLAKDTTEYEAEEQEETAGDEEEPETLIYSSDFSSDYDTDEDEDEEEDSEENLTAATT